MTRGKHGRAAAQRRAASAEGQLDRLMEEVTDLRRQVKTYKGEAEAAPVLRRQLVELKDRNGIAVDEHIRLMAEQEAKHDKATEARDHALSELIDKLIEIGSVRMPKADEWISGVLMDGMRALPRPAAMHLMRHMGIERHLARGLLDRTLRDRVTAHSMGDARMLNELAEREGLVPKGSGLIPHSLLIPPTRDQAFGRTNDDDDEDDEQDG